MPGAPYDRRICPVCHGEFTCVYASSWAYKIQYYNTKWILCSYKCMQEKKKEIEKEKGRRKKAIE